VSTGELSTDVSKLERQLTNIFRLGHRWGALVLLDEADVLMSKRSSSDMDHSAVVAGKLKYCLYD
jgi:hypothetical protein